MFSLTIKTPRLEAMRQFYQCIMPQMAMKQVKVGGHCYVGLSGNVEFVLYPESNPNEDATPKLQFSFKLSEIESVVKSLGAVSGAQTLMEVSEVPDGKMAIVLDPDGNSVQVIQNI